jgi:TRAP-type transport system periplasmic protein
MNTIKAKWLISHEPAELFLRTAKAFSDEIKKLTDNRIHIEVITEEEHAKLNNGIAFNPVVLLQSGEIDMSQLYSGALGQRQATDFYALDLPFLFTDHDHASRVFEGEIGKYLLEEHLVEKADIRGLAFTYSGGFRVLASNKKIEKVEDLTGTTMAFHRNPLFQELAESVGAKGQLKLGTWDKKEEDHVEECDIVHTTLPRYYAEAIRGVHKYVTNANHSLFLTTIVIAEQFWNKLSVEDQMHMRAAALHASRLERKWTIEDSDKITKSTDEQSKLGIEGYNQLDNQEVDQFKHLVRVVYDKYEKFFTPGLVKKIKDA